jgi:hypothetical protein
MVTWSRLAVLLIRRVSLAVTRGLCKENWGQCLQTGGMSSEDTVHGLSALQEHRPDLLAVHGLRHLRAARVADQAGDVLNRDTGIRQQRDEAVPHLARRPGLGREGRLGDDAAERAGCAQCLPKTRTPGRVPAVGHGDPGKNALLFKDILRKAPGTVPEFLAQLIKASMQL